MKIFPLFLTILALPIYASIPVGTPDNGTLLNGESLSEQGEGFMQLFRERDHIYATRALLTMLKLTAADMAQRYPNRDRLQIEEMSARNGGDVEGHGSHENGLDVDLEYFKANGVEHNPILVGTYFAEPMVKGGIVSLNFDVERNWELAKSLHAHGNVQKIFMDQSLKDRLCQYARSINEFRSNQNVLRSIRHVINHADHLHVRLRCPAEAKQCRNLPETAPGAGCP